MNKILIKKMIKYFVITFLILAFAMVGLWKISNSRTFQFFGGIVSSVDTDKKLVALTFDDGPTKENTDKVLKILKELDIKATFFVIGDNLEKNLDEGRKIVLAGHELGNHTYSHQRMILKSQSYIKKEIEKTDSLIRQAGYLGEINFRPPNGKKLLGLPYYLKEHNRHTIMWNLEPDSISELEDSSDKMISYVYDNVKPGSIILLHVMYNSRKESVNSIKGIVTSLKNKGYKFVTVTELMKEKEKE